MSIRFRLLVCTHAYDAPPCGPLRTCRRANGIKKVARARFLFTPFPRAAGPGSAPAPPGTDAKVGLVEHTQTQGRQLVN